MRTRSMSRRRRARSCTRKYARWSARPRSWGRASGRPTTSPLRSRSATAPPAPRSRRPTGSISRGWITSSRPCSALSRAGEGWHALCERGSQRPAETVGQIGTGDQTLRQNFVEAPPFLPRVRRRFAVEQIVHLARVILEIVEFVLEAGAVEAEVHRVGPVAFADRTDMTARGAGGDEEEVVERKDRMVLHRL